MKKIILYILLLNSCLGQTLFAMEGEQKQSKETKIETSDGNIYKISLKAAQESETLNQIIADFAEEEEGDLIPLPVIDGKVFEKVRSTLYYLTFLIEKNLSLEDQKTKIKEHIINKLKEDPAIVSKWLNAINFLAVQKVIDELEKIFFVDKGQGSVTNLLTSASIPPALLNIIFEINELLNRNELKKRNDGKLIPENIRKNINERLSSLDKDAVINLLMSMNSIYNENSKLAAAIIGIVVNKDDEKISDAFANDYQNLKTLFEEYNRLKQANLRIKSIFSISDAIQTRRNRPIVYATPIGQVYHIDKKLGLAKLTGFGINYLSDLDLLEKQIPLDQIKYLNLRNNTIPYIPEDFLEKFPNLKQLDLSKNKINTISPKVMKQLQNLENVNLEENQLEEGIVNMFQKPEEIIELDEMDLL